MECSQQLLSVILSVVVIIAGVANHGGVAAQPSGCTSFLQTLFPCAGYVTSNVSSSPPTQGCCKALSSVVHSNAVCLCQLFTANNSLGIPINQANALALPGACNVTTPLPQCNVAGAPASSPFTGVPTTSPPKAALTDSSAPTEEEIAPSSFPALSPSSHSPLLSPTPSVRGISPTAIKKPASPPLLSPITSVRGISPTTSEKRTSKAGALSSPSTIISALTVAMVVSSIL